jgi:hypothetical protein
MFLAIALNLGRGFFFRVPTYQTNGLTEFY